MNDIVDTPPAAVTVLFCSTGENIGRTTTIINLAMVLAGSGLKVLIVDAHRSETRAAHYLGRFIVVPDPSGVGFPRPVREGAPRSEFVPRIADVEYDGADISGRTSLIVVDHGESGDQPDIRSIIGSAGSGFDYVLVDAPREGAGSPASALSRLSAVADIVVACFTLNDRAIEGSAALARRVQREAGHPVGIVALGMRADTTLAQPLEQARTVVRTRFSQLGPESGVPYVQIPYAPVYSYSDLTVLPREPTGEPADGRTGDLRTAYEALADVLTDGGLEALRRVTLVYSPRHRAWSEWAQAQLEGLGARVKTIPMERFGGEVASGGSAVVVISPTGIDTEAAGRLRRMRHPGLRMVLVDDPLPEGLTDAEVIDLRGLGEPSAVRALRRGLRIGGPHADVPVGVRFPGARPLSNLPPRNPRFVGRDHELEALRDALLGTPAGGPVRALHGPPGMGKSEIALEYAHRFGGGYDIVWWLPAQGEGSVRASLGDLAAALAIPTAADAAEAALRHLGAPESGRWLLVFDGATDQDGLPGLTPEARDRCHVIVTTRSAEPSGGAEITIAPFGLAESVALVRARLPGLLPEQAEIVGERVGRVPLLVDLAAAWVTTMAARLRQDNLMSGAAVRQAVERFSEDFNHKHAELLAHGATTTLARVMVELTLDALPNDIGGTALRRESIGGQATLRLLEVCALLSPDGAGLALLRSPAMLELLTTGDRLSDPLMIDVMLRTMGRYGLIQADLGRPGLPVRMHPLVGDLVRDRMGSRADDLRAELRLTLASWAPADPGDESAPRVYAELEKHLDALAPWQDPRPPVRRWVLRQLGMLLRRADRLARDRAKEIGLLALQEWDEESAQRLRLLNVLAQVCRLRGDYEDNRRYSYEALRSQRRVLGVNHPRTLLTAGAHAAALRAMGEFEEALEEERNVLRELRELLGANHVQTGDAMHNLAISEALTGDPRRALSLACGQHALRVSLSGEGDPRAVRAAIAMARYHRDLGEPRRSYDILKRVLNRRGSHGHSRQAHPDLDVLRAESGLAITERRLGSPHEARERDERILSELRAHQGEHDLATLTCQASLAADLGALGKHQAAVDHARDCLDGLYATFGPDHPYTQVCEIAHAAYLREAGRPRESAQRGERALGLLHLRLGEAHPWTLAAGVALATTLVTLGELHRAADLEQQVQTGFSDAGLSDHPNARLAAANLADTRSRMAGEAPADRPARGEIDLEIPEL